MTSFLLDGTSSCQRETPCLTSIVKSLLPSLKLSKSPHPTVVDSSVLIGLLRWNLTNCECPFKSPDSDSDKNGPTKDYPFLDND